MVKRRGNSTPKTKVSRGLLHMQHESAAEPLVVAKVIRQYTRKKKVETTTSVNTPTSSITVNIAALSSEQSDSKVLIDNHVKIKEEIPENFPGIEIMDDCVEIEGNNVSQNKVGKEDICFKIKEENVPEIRVVSKLLSRVVGNFSDQNCEDCKKKDYVKIKKEDVSETQVNLTEMGLHQNCSNKNDTRQYKTRTIKIKDENVPCIDMNINSNSEGVQQSSEFDFTIKVEPIDDLQYTNIEQKSINTYTDGPQSKVNKAIEIPKAEKIGCNSHNDIIEASCITEKYMPAKNCHKVLNHPYTPPKVIHNAEPALQAEKNMSELKQKILITEEIHIKEEIVSDTDMDCIEKERDKTSSESIKEKPQQDKKPAVETIQLRRIMNVPRILKTYGKKQPDPVTLKKCFLVAVNTWPAKSTKKSLSPEEIKPIYKCDICGRNFNRKSSVRRHMRFAHVIAKRHRCPSCPAAFPHHYLLLAHVRSHSGAPLACDLCPKRFESKTKYGLHLNTHLRERLFACPVCLRRFTELDVLRRHAEKHTPEDTFPCDACKENFRTAIELRRHSERDHSEEVEFPCYVCSRILSSNADFLAHAKTHDNAMCECAFCGTSFHDPQKWEEHSSDHIERIGRGENAKKPHTCEYCKKTFDYRSVLKTHLRMHSKERPFECPECGRTLKTKSALTEHINSHKRPYPCHECNKRFGRRDSLSRHMLLHSGDRPHACPGCPMTFVQRSAMLTHMRRFHEPCLKRMPKKSKKTKKND